MVRWFCGRFRQTVRRLGLLAALVALAGQVAFGAIIPAEIVPRMQLAALLAGAVICHAHAPSDPSDRKSSPHQSDCALCCLCHALARVGALLAPPLVALAPPAMLAVRRAFLPPARAPPPPTFSTTYPRGPPALI
jgi:hypothetical protein